MLVKIVFWLKIKDKLKNQVGKIWRDISEKAAQLSEKAGQIDAISTISTKLKQVNLTIGKQEEEEKITLGVPPIEKIAQDLKKYDKISKKNSC